MTIYKYVAAYDISDNKERNGLIKVLTDFGVRVQLSVFEFRLKAADFKRLCAKIDTLKIRTGYIKIYKIDESQAFLSGDVPDSMPDNNYVYYF